jgi:hypothetical protein
MPYGSCDLLRACRLKGANVLIWLFSYLWDTRVSRLWPLGSALDVSSARLIVPLQISSWSYVVIRRWLVGPPFKVIRRVEVAARLASDGQLVLSGHPDLIPVYSESRMQTSWKSMIAAIFDSCREKSGFSRLHSQPCLQTASPAGLSEARNARRHTYTCNQRHHREWL